MGARDDRWRAGTLIMSKWKTVAEICAREQRRRRRNTMTMMMARICFHESEVEDYIADLKSYGFTVLSHVYPNEPEYVFVEATIDIGQRVPHSEHVRSLLKVLGQVDTIDLGKSGTRDELAIRLLELLRQLMPMGSVTGAGPVPAGYIPFEPLPPIPTATPKPKLAVSEIEDMDEENLLEINEKYDLGINLYRHGTMIRKRNAIIAGLVSAKMLLEDDSCPLNPRKQ
jgi:hypothetical protein